MLQKPYQMLKPFSIFLFVFFISSVGLAQQKLTWDDLADVKFKPKHNEKYGIDFLMPTFGDKIKSYEGKKISITGYFLDLSGNGKVLLISKNPMASCFFCGASGPETIIEVVFKEEPPFRTDQIVEVTGLLELNSNDVERCNYLLKEVTGKLAG